MTLFLKKYSRPQAAYCLCDSEDCYILLVLFLKSLFRPQIFRRPISRFSQNFGTRHGIFEIDYVLWGVHMSPKIWGKKNNNLATLRT